MKSAKPEHTFFMKIPKSKSQIRPQDRNPDNSKCNDQRSRDISGKGSGGPGDRGMCEKQSTSQGSE